MQRARIAGQAGTVAASRRVARPEEISDECAGPSQQTVPAFVPLDQERVKQAKQNLMASSKGQKSRIHDRMGLTVGASGASGAAL